MRSSIPFENHVASMLQWSPQPSSACRKAELEMFSSDKVQKLKLLECFNIKRRILSSPFSPAGAAIPKKSVGRGVDQEVSEGKGEAIPL